MKIKLFFISAVLSSLLLSMPVSAEPETTSKENNEVTTKTTVSETVVTDAPETTEITTAYRHGAGSVILNQDESQSAFNEIYNYVGEDDAVNLNENLKNNALAINSTTIDYSDKSMFTITTRSGDVFYLIINNSDGSCMFLNTVDTADLTSLLNKGSNDNTLNENAISEIEEIEEIKQQEETLASEYENESLKTTTITKKLKSEEKPNYIKNLVLIGIAIAGCGLAALLFTLIKKKKGSSNNSYDDSFNEDFNNLNNNAQNSPDSDEDEEIEEYIE